MPAKVKNLLLERGIRYTVKFVKQKLQWSIFNGNFVVFRGNTAECYNYLNR